MGEDWCLGINRKVGKCHCLPLEIQNNLAEQFYFTNGNKKILILFNCYDYFFLFDQKTFEVIFQENIDGEFSLSMVQCEPTGDENTFGV